MQAKLTSLLDRTFDLTLQDTFEDRLQGGPKNLHTVLYTLTSSNIDWFSNLFHYQNQENICNDTVTKDSTTPQVCFCTTLWNVCILKATIEQDDFCYNTF